MIYTARNKRLIENIETLRNLEAKINILNEENKTLIEVIEKREKALQQIINEKSIGFPWLAEAIAEFHRYQDIEIAKYLEEKKHPAYKKADLVRDLSQQNKILRKQLKIAQNFVQYYESLFPWLTDYIDENLGDLLDGVVNNGRQEDTDIDDPVLKYIPKSEYEKLSPSERNQKALNRYIRSRKRPYEIGRDYERFIGYLYEQEGYKVQYLGIEKGLEDLGRDLVCIKKDKIEIVQCKYWAAHKTIHEKHINQLYGTVVKYFIDQSSTEGNNNGLMIFSDLVGSKNISGTFITSTKLSETAKLFARALGINFIENKQLDDYPLIKCNINALGEKIYHLPFDQQYDKTVIKNDGEFYASTVNEAEQKGFRRAFKWRGSTTN